jgi:hypothetical protein
MGAGRSILVILLIMIGLFFIITLILFFVTVYLRIRNSYRDSRKKRRSQHWDPIILAVMDGSLLPHQAFDQLKWKKSNEYLLHLELYVDMVKGEEKQRLLKLGRLSSEKLHDLLIAKNRRKRLYGVHLLGLFQPVDQYKYLCFNGNDFEMTLTMIREMRTVNDFRLKEKLINMLFVFKYISPIYISNILVDMGEEIVPILRIMIVDRRDHPYEQIIAIETLRRMHYSGCLDMAEGILEHIDHPGVLTSYLKYMEEMGDERQKNLIIPLLDHGSIQVRKAAVNAYLAISDELTSEDIYRFFNDPVVQIAVSAANKLKLMNTVPFIELDEINQFKWADIYKRMVY